MGGSAGVRSRLYAAVVDGCRLRGERMGRAAGREPRQSRRDHRRYALFITQARVAEIYYHAPDDPDRRHLGQRGGNRRPLENR